MSGLSCSRCGRTGIEIAWSCQRKANVCRQCLPVGLVVRLPKRAPEPRRKPTRFERYYDRVHETLERLTQCGVIRIGDGTRRTFAFCPACREGTILVQLHDLDVPTMTITSSAWPGHCSLGCSEGFIARVMFS